MVMEAFDGALVLVFVHVAGVKRIIRLVKQSKGVKNKQIPLHEDYVLYARINGDRWARLD